MPKVWRRGDSPPANGQAGADVKTTRRCGHNAVSHVESAEGQRSIPATRDPNSGTRGRHDRQHSHQEVLDSSSSRSQRAGRDEVQVDDCQAEYRSPAHNNPPQHTGANHARSMHEYVAIGHSATARYLSVSRYLRCREHVGHRACHAGVLRPLETEIVDRSDARRPADPPIRPLLPSKPQLCIARYFSNHFRMCTTLAIKLLGRAAMPWDASGIRTMAVGTLRSFNAW